MGTSEVALIFSVLVNVIALYGAFRKTRTVAKKAEADAEIEKLEVAVKKADAAVEAEIGDRVIARWQKYAAEQEAARKRESRRLEREIGELRAELETARQENADLQVEVRQLRADLKRAGINPSGEGG